MTNSDIKIINQKIRRLARKYGTTNIEYQKYLVDIDRNFTTHTTKDGIVQINNVAAPSEYQQQIIKKLKGRRGVRELQKAAKKRIKHDKGEEYKPTAAEIDKEVMDFSMRQSKIDDTLESIYTEMRDGTLPPDIADIYSKIHRTKGSGWTNADIDYLNAALPEWQRYKAEIQDIAARIKQLPYVDDYILQLIWQANRGQIPLREIPDVLDRLREYYETATKDDETQG